MLIAIWEKAANRKKGNKKNSDSLAMLHKTKGEETTTRAFLAMFMIANELYLFSRDVVEKIGSY